MKIQTLIAAVALTLGAAAFAQAPAAPAGPLATPRIDQRQVNQQNRINQGVNSGQLTAREAVRVEKREGKIAVHEAKAKADGVVTPSERRRLRREENRASKAIYRQKHDRQTTSPAR